MASLTIRKLDDAIRNALRLRAARSGRSVEDEVRVILREAAQEGSSVTPKATSRAPTLSSLASPSRTDTGLARVTLIIGGGIAAYKALDLIRRLKKRHIHVRCVLTRAAQHFVTPLAASALSNERCYTDLFDPESEFDAGHIRLAREADLIVVAPATADLMAKMAHGTADDLASAILLASGAPILIAPAMNPLMWNNAATRRNVATLQRDGIATIGPNAGEMAEAGEAGLGRMAEPLEIAAAVERLLRPPQPKPLAGKRILITAGPTHEPIDPVRYIANRSSGRQGHAIAQALADLGARVTLVHGPVALPPPPRVDARPVETAAQMLDAVQAALPADVAVFNAAVADWRVRDAAAHKLKKTADAPPPALALVANPDILATIAGMVAGRPRLVVGFAAETDDVEAHGQAKRVRKGADWIVANDVSDGVFGGAENAVRLITAEGSEAWPRMAKTEVARLLADRIARALT